MTDDDTTANYPTDAQRADMIESVEAMIVGKCKGFARYATGNAGDYSVSDDAAQACRLALWKIAADFRLDGRAKWATYAYVAIGHALAHFRSELHAATLRGQCQADGRGIDFKSYVADEADESGDLDPGESDLMGRTLRALRADVFADLLDALSPGQRRLVELVVFDGLPLPRVAEQLGLKLDIVEKAFRGVVATLNRKGMIPAGTADEFGVTVREARPPKAWGDGEKLRFLNAVQSDRPAREIADEFAVRYGRVTAARRRLRAQAPAVAA